MRERLPASTGKACNRDSIRAKIFEGDGGGGGRGNFLRKFPLPPPIFLLLPREFFQPGVEPGQIGTVGVGGILKEGAAPVKQRLGGFGGVAVRGGVADHDRVGGIDALLADNALPQMPVK